jgi:hypothetical protein
MTLADCLIDCDMRGSMLSLADQAPGCYERHGWSEFGGIGCDPSGAARVGVTETLQRPKQC